MFIGVLMANAVKTICRKSSDKWYEKSSPLVIEDPLEDTDILRNTARNLKKEKWDKYDVVCPSLFQATASKMVVAVLMAADN